MKKENMRFILQEGEGLKIEFKESFESKSLAKELRKPPKTVEKWIERLKKRKSITSAAQRLEDII